MELNYKLVLGSKSPRRSELLTKAGLLYEQRVIETDESYPDDLPIAKIAEYIALQKAAAHEGVIAKDELLLTADTIVVYSDKVYGKPKDRTDAITTIMKLQSDVHTVYTGVVLKSADSINAFTVKSEVKFGQISQEETESYVDEFKPYDKAGSYGIQDWIGFTRIEWIKGSYTNILGLPMSQVWDALKAY